MAGLVQDAGHGLTSGCRDDPGDLVADELVVGDAHDLDSTARLIAARGEDRPDSDVDLLVDLPPHMGLLGLGRVQADLEAILGTKVDLVPASDLKPAVRARAERDLVAL